MADSRRGTRAAKIEPGKPGLPECVVVGGWHFERTKHSLNRRRWLERLKRERFSLSSSRPPVSDRAPRPATHEAHEHATSYPHDVRVWSEQERGVVEADADPGEGLVRASAEEQVLVASMQVGQASLEGVADSTASAPTRLRSSPRQATSQISPITSKTNDLATAARFPRGRARPRLPAVGAPAARSARTLPQASSVNSSSARRATPNGKPTRPMAASVTNGMRQRGPSCVCRLRAEHVRVAKRESTGAQRTLGRRSVISPVLLVGTFAGVRVDPLRRRPVLISAHLGGGPGCWHACRSWPRWAACVPRCSLPLAGSCLAANWWCVTARCWGAGQVHRAELRCDGEREFLPCRARPTGRRETPLCAGAARRRYNAVGGVLGRLGEERVPAQAETA
jgi:hypothetical protein